MNQLKMKNMCVEKNELHYDPEHFDFETFYVELDDLEGDRDGKWEHHELHEFDDPIEYYNEIPPVIVKKLEEGEKTYTFSDGFHRVNFCVEYNLPVPCVVVTPKKGTHTHYYAGAGRICLIWDHECKGDLEAPQWGCYWVQCKKTGKKYKRGKPLEL